MAEPSDTQARSEFLDSLMDTELYSIGAYFCDEHPELVDEVVATSDEIEASGLEAYAAESGAGLAETVTGRIWPNVQLQWEDLGGLPPMRRAAVIGAGSWGTALAVLLARGGLEVQLGTRSAERVAEMTEAGENRRYLPGVPLPETVDVRPASEIELARATGATPLHEVIWGVIPQVGPLWTSYALYRFESNSRSATVLGLIGAGGIGQLLFETLNAFDYHHLSAIVIVIIVAVTLIDLLSQLMRSRLL